MKTLREIKENLVADMEITHEIVHLCILRHIYMQKALLICKALFNDFYNTVEQNSCALS